MSLNIHRPFYNPLHVAHWDSWLDSNRQSGFFHTSEWASVLTRAYRYKPVYFAEVDRQRLTAVLPVMEIDSFLTGRRGVSLPFTDCCPPLSQSPAQLQSLIHSAFEYAKHHNWRSIEFRVATPLPLGAEPTCKFNHHTVFLENPLRGLERTIRESALRNAKHAEKSGVRVVRSHTLSAMREFYDLNCTTRKRHGLPPQPWRFFELLLEIPVRGGMGDIFLASFEGKPVAGALFLHFRKNVIYKFGASDAHFHRLRANNLLMWQAIQHYAANGYRTIDLGRTEIGHSGLLQYKRGWGAKEASLYYYRYDLQRKTVLKEKRESPPGYSLFRKLPIPALRLIGRLLYPHVG